MSLRVWIWLCLLAALCAACKSTGIDKLDEAMAGDFKVDVRCADFSKVQDVFVIVGDAAKLAELDRKESIAGLVLSSRQADYRVFMQFVPPVPNDPKAEWEKRVEKNQIHQKFEHETREKKRTLRLTLNRTLFSSDATARLVVIVHLKDQSWFARAVDKNKMENGKGEILDVGEAGIASSDMP